MTYFHELSTAHQSLLLCCMFAPILPALFCIHLSRFGKHRFALRTVCSTLFIVLFLCVVLCVRELQNVLSFRPFPVPVWALWSISLFACALLVTMAVGLVRRMRNTIGPIPSDRQSTRSRAASAFLTPTAPSSYAIYRCTDCSAHSRKATCNLWMSCVPQYTLPVPIAALSPCARQSRRFFFPTGRCGSTRKPQ